MYRKKKIKIKRYFGLYRCFLWVWVFSFVCEAVILMGTAMGILGFYAVKGIYFAKIQKQTGKLWIFAVALIFYAAEYLLWGSSYFITENTFINPYYLVDIFIMNPALILIAVAQNREEKLCRTI